MKGLRLSRRSILSAHAARMTSVSIGEIAASVDVLFSLERRLNRINEANCNEPSSDRRDKAEVKLQGEARAIAARLGMKVRFNGDPRGGALKVLDVECGNDLGSEFPCCD